MRYNTNSIKDKTRTIAYYLFCFILSIPFYVFRVFPIKRKRIFVYGFLNQGVGDHPKYIIDNVLDTDQDYTIYWASNKKGGEENRHVKYVKPKSVSAAFYQTTSRIWISTVRLPFYMRKRNGQIYIQTWHGAINLKKIEGECIESLTERYILMAKHDSQMIDYLIAANQDKVDLFSKYFWYNGNGVLKLGSPRNDIFFNSTPHMREQIKAKYDCTKKKILVYAPTFRANKGIELYKINYELLRTTAEKKFGGEWIVYLRLHPTLAKRAKELIEYSNLIRNGSVIDDVQELLLITDLLVTDYSSIVFDYMDTKRPAFIYAPDIEEYTKERDFHISPFDTPFSIAKTEKELIHNIEEFQTLSYENRIRDFADKIGVFDEGKACKVISDLICRI